MDCESRFRRDARGKRKAGQKYRRNNEDVEPLPTIYKVSLQLSLPIFVDPLVLDFMFLEKVFFSVYKKAYDSKLFCLSLFFFLSFVLEAMRCVFVY